MSNALEERRYESSTSSIMNVTSNSNQSDDLSDETEDVGEENEDEK